MLRKSDLVRTGPGAAAEITFFDGTVVHVRPDSLITIEETSEDPSTKRRKVAWHISSGEVQFNAPRPNAAGSEREISTPTLRTTTREAAAGGVAVQESGESNIKLYTGTATVATKTGETVQLAANTQLKVDAAGKAEPVHNLPQVPVLLAPQHQAEITYQDPARADDAPALEARPGRGRLSRDARLQRLLQPAAGRPRRHQRAVRRGARARRPASTTGGWPRWTRTAWRAASPSSRASRSAARQGGARGSGDPPPLVIESIDVRQNIIQVRGRTEPGATLTVNGQRVDVAADGAFNEFIQLPAEKPGRQLVAFRVVGINGGVAEAKRPVMVGE